MKNRMTPIALATALICSVGLASCAGGGEKKAKAETKQAAVATPQDLYLYSQKDQAAKKKVEVPHLGFTQQVKATREREFEENAALRGVYIQKGFSHIANYSFANCPNLETLSLDGTIDVINDNAFENCVKLKEVKGDIRTIGLSAFKGCTALDRVALTDNLYWIRDDAFVGCTNLRSVLLSTTLVKFEDGAFRDCPNIEEISVPSDYRRYMFNIYKEMKKLQRVYLLVMEHYAFPEKSKDFPCEQVDLYVPDAFVNAYKADKSWARFKSILPLSQSDYYTAEGWVKK